TPAVMINPREAEPQSNNYIGEIIIDGTHSSPGTINWSASFVQFIKAITSSKLHHSHGQTSKQSFPSTQTGAKTMKRIKAHTQGPSTSCTVWATGMSDIETNGDNSSNVEFEDLDIYIDHIYAKNGMNTGYDWVNPVYLHPTNPDEYILLTRGNLNTWAKALVSLLSHSSYLSLLCLQTPSSNSANPINKRRSPRTSQCWLQILWWIQGGSLEELSGYLEFVHINQMKQQGILKHLLSHDINNFHIFGSLTYEELKDLGFNVGIISKL
ncbi:uncharacterized protein VP01_3818g1, partial [Puccinia sorghi]